MLNGRRKTGMALAILGSIVLLAAAALHLIGAYPRVSSAVRGSNLSADLESALRAVFFLIGWDWIVIAIIVFVAAFTETRIRSVMVLFCGFALLVQSAVMFAFVGWFVGTDIILASALLILCGGYLCGPGGQNEPS